MKLPRIQWKGTLERIRNTRLPDLPPSRRAVIPEPRRISLRSGYKKTIHLVLLFLALVLFVVVQLGIGYLSVEKGPSVSILLSIIVAIMIVVFSARDVRWRVFLFSMLVTALSANIGFIADLTRAYWFFSTYFLKQLVSLGFVIWVLFDALGAPKRRLPPLALSGALLLVAVAIVTSLVAQERPPEGKVIRQAVIEALFFLSLAWAAFSYFTDWSKAQAMLKFMVVIALIYAITGIFEYFYPYKFFTVRRVLVAGQEQYANYYSIIGRRAASFFHDPISYAQFLAIFTPFAVYPVIYGKTLPRRLWGAAGLALVAVAIFFTGARGPFLTLLLVVVLLPWLAGKRRLAILWTGSFIGLVAVMAMLAPFLGKALPRNNMIVRLTNPQEGTFATFDERTKRWNEAVEVWREHPVVGIGYGQWVQQRLTSLAQEAQGMKATHSAYVQILVETGALGTVAFAALILTILFGGLRALSRSPGGTRRGMAAALYCACLVQLITGFTSNSFAVSTGFFLLCVTAAMLFKVPIVAREESEVPAEEPVSERTDLAPVRPLWRPAPGAPADAL